MTMVLPTGLDPINYPSAWNTVNIGVISTPGYCEVSEFKRKHEWDVKKGKGVYGGTITFVGRPPATGSIKFYWWEPADYIQWTSIIIPLLSYDPTKLSVVAVDIYHPSLAAVGITSVVTENIGNIIHEGLGLYSITIDFIEYFPPPKIAATSTPLISVPTQDGTIPGDPPDPVSAANQAEIASLLAKATAP